MKKVYQFILCTLSLVFWSVSVYAQQPAVQRMKDTSLTYVLNNIRASYKTQTKDFVVRLFEVSNESGSAITQQNETDEVTDNLYIAISEIEEKPRQLLFVIKDVYAPSDINLTKQSEQAIQLSFWYMDKGEKKRYTALIKEDGIYP